MGKYHTYSFPPKKQNMGQKRQLIHPIIIVAKLGELTLCKAFCPLHPFNFYKSLDGIIISSSLLMWKFCSKHIGGRV